MNIIILGAPGAGKGTQSQFLIDLFKLKHLSTGDMLRAEIEAATELGMQAKSIMDTGELVSDSIVIRMIKERLTREGILFDGFPRTLNQAQELDKLMIANNMEIDKVILLEVDNEEIIQRMLARGRADDNETTIRNRLQVYNQQTAPLIDYYEKQNKLARIDGMGEVDTISKRIEQAMQF